jgi:polar amino acid transport system substrate-binding protein
MKHLALAALGSLLLAAAPVAADNAVAPGGTLRAAYLASNPAQAVQDRATGAIRGASADLARELGRRLNIPVELKPLVNVAAVIEAVGGAALASEASGQRGDSTVRAPDTRPEPGSSARGQADIGFIAYEPSRAATVDFSQTYMLVQQSFLVLEDSPIRAIADVDQAGRKVAGTRADSITLFMKRKLKQATLVELENNPAEIKRLLTGKEIDAFGANRQRLTNLMKETPGTRILPDSLFGVPQTIIVLKGKADALTVINRFLDDARASGFLRSAIEKSGIIGIEAAPGGSWTPSVPE